MNPGTQTFADIVTTKWQLRAIRGQPSHRLLAKQGQTLDSHCLAFIAKTPFVLIPSADRAGAMDVSPKGNPPGCVRVLDDATLAIPARLSNRKVDTFANILQNTRDG